MVRLIVNLFRLVKTKPVIVPDGIAHFLEHKMFEKEEGDVFQKFSEKGCICKCIYFFYKNSLFIFLYRSCFRKYENIVDFVQQPYFTEQTVEKEKGIIAQEITMYDDQPDWRLYFGTIENMYKEHPVKIDIAGTVETINQITAEHLYECYNTFYHPSNMVLFVVGAVNPEEMMDFIKEDQAAKTFEEPQEIKRFFLKNKKQLHISERTLQMDVQKPKVIFGIKASNTDISGE